MVAVSETNTKSNITSTPLNEIHTYIQDSVSVLGFRYIESVSQLCEFQNKRSSYTSLVYLY